MPDLPQPAARQAPCPFSTAAPLVLKLYIADNSLVSLLAIGNLTELLRPLPADCYRLEIIDGLDDPARAIRDGVLVTPTLLKISPAPPLSLLGNLADRQHVLRVLGITEEAA